MTRALKKSKICGLTEIRKGSNLEKYCGRDLPLDNFKRKGDIFPGEIDLPENREAQCLDCVKKTYDQKMLDLSLDKHLDRIRKRCNIRERARHVPVCIQSMIPLKNATGNDIILHDTAGIFNQEIVPVFSVYQELGLQEVIDKWHYQKGNCNLCQTKLKLYFSDKNVFRTLGEKNQEEDLNQDTSSCLMLCEPTLAVIDRIDTSNDRAPYTGNFQFLCYKCNYEKSDQDIIDKIQSEKNRAKCRAKKLETIIMGVIDSCGLSYNNENGAYHTPALEIQEQEHLSQTAVASFTLNSTQSSSNNNNNIQESMALAYYKLQVSQLQEKYDNLLQQTARLAYLRQREKKRNGKYKKWIHKYGKTDSLLDKPIHISLNMSDFCKSTCTNLKELLFEVEEITVQDSPSPEKKQQKQKKIKKTRKRKSSPILFIDLNSSE